MIILIFNTHLWVIRVLRISFLGNTKSQLVKYCLFSIPKKSLACREQVLCVAGLNSCVSFNCCISEIHLWVTNDSTCVQSVHFL